MKISIVTINRNDKTGLVKTVESVLRQTSSDIEYIIIDGGSTDGSVEIIEKHKEKLSFYLSEPDSGIYNAMNKGLNKATGDYVLFLNSGDYLASNNVIEVIQNFIQNEDVFYGNIGINKDEDVQEIASASKVEFYKKYQHNLPPHPATFIRTDLLRTLGGFDEGYKIISDVVLISRIFSNSNTTYKHINMLVTIFDTQGISSINDNQKKIYEERKRFIGEHFPDYLQDFEKVYKNNIFRKVFGKFKNKLLQQ